MIIDIVNIDFEMISNHSESLFSKLFKFFYFAKNPIFNNQKIEHILEI